ncbi:MAG: DUF1549 domain-containing protein [Verrucomicrobiales bacterium]|nr:DUF1549 domain-containing protein [Verrucomicrobiales bacterium]
MVILLALSIPAGPGNSQEKEHWAYQPVKKPENPGLGIDFFLNDLLEDSTEADRHIQLRRVSLNLTGLPPTMEEIVQFVSDKSDDVYEKMTERLLNSPHYGERWGRHWLDVARYVQGKIKVPGVDRIDLAEEYRDYVVRSFNSDKPYDQFVAEQLAGDLLEGDDSGYFDRKIAPAFLSIGPWFDECTDPNQLKLDIVDEQISTATKAFLGLDFACSRCHDHKFDPIPTRDYYAMAGIFRSTKIISNFSEFWKDGRPRLTQPLALPAEIEKSEKIQQQIDDLEKLRWSELNRLRKKFIEANETAFRSESGQVVPAKQMKAWEAEDFSGYKNLVTVKGKYTPAIEARVPLDQWVQYDFHLDEAGEFSLYLRYATAQAAPVKLELNREMTDQRIPIAKTGGTDYRNYRWEAFGPFAFKKGANRIRLMADKHEPFPRLDALKIVKNSEPRPTGALQRALWRYSHSKTFWPPMASEMELLLPDSQLTKVAEIDKKIGDLLPQVQLPQTLAVKDREELISEPVRAGGNTYQLKGDPVPRAVPTLFQSISEDYPVASDSSGRLELARWMTDRNNALTARVMVNRIWHWHFGTGIVATTDNFGIQGAKPENPELLDWLAAEFMESGWSVKHIQRLLVNSRYYRSNEFPRRRLEAEAIYDSMLGTLDKVPRQASGAKLNTQLSRDRALYILISSRSPKGLGQEIRKMFQLFGFDSSGRPIHDRPDAVTPDQALFFLNNPLPKYYADQLADKLLSEGKRVEKTIIPAFLTVLGHPPDQMQLAASGNYIKDLQSRDLSDREILSRLILGLFSSDDFIHIY